MPRKTNLASFCTLPSKISTISSIKMILLKTQTTHTTLAQTIGEEATIYATAQSRTHTTKDQTIGTTALKVTTTATLMNQAKAAPTLMAIASVIQAIIFQVAAMWTGIR